MLWKQKETNALAKLSGRLGETKERVNGLEKNLSLLDDEVKERFHSNKKRIDKHDDLLYTMSRDLNSGISQVRRDTLKAFSILLAAIIANSFSSPEQRDTLLQHLLNFLFI